MNTCTELLVDRCCVMSSVRPRSASPEQAPETRPALIRFLSHNTSCLILGYFSKPLKQPQYFVESLSSATLHAENKRLAEGSHL